MQNIKKLVNELVARGVIATSVGDFFIKFVIRNGGLSDIKDKDVFEIIEEISAMKFGTGLNLSDKWLPDEHKRKTTILLAEACVSSNKPNDVSKVFAIYVAICKKNMLC